MPGNPLLSEEEIRAKLVEIHQLGWVRTIRAGDTGIGATLEQRAGIPENNLPGPDNIEFELKSTRTTSTSLITLLTRNPKPRGTNTKLRAMYGYPSREFPGKKELHTTVNAIDYNTIKGQRGFIVKIKPAQVVLVDASGVEVGYWDKDVL